MGEDFQLAAFRRLLREGTAGGQAKVDALIALMQRTVYVVPWGGGVDGFRTLVNSDGVAALPIFTDLAELSTAATRYGWLGEDGKPAHTEVGARQALHYARTQNVAFVVVDIAAEHGLEVSREEIEPLLTPAARRESSGPFAGAGRISSTLMRAVRSTSATPAPGSIAAASPSSSGAIRAPTPPPGSMPDASRSSIAHARPAAITTDAAIVPSTRLAALAAPASDELLDALDAVLREYPEVEWASLGQLSSGMAIGVRIDGKMRARLPEIASRLSDAVGTSVPIVTLDVAADVRAARVDALAFYPWRRK